jgi:8-oxo-dGTP pyrophosphatase MutT (NUDIX family)
LGDSVSSKSPTAGLVELCEVSLTRQPDVVDSAILILLLSHQDQTYLVSTRRPKNMRTSAGEIVLPGGRVDEGESPREAALRECKEEIGIGVGPEAVIGELPGFLRALRKPYWITPVVAHMEVSSLVFSVNPVEVEEVILTPVSSWLERATDDPFFSVTPQGEYLAKGNAFALEVLRQRLHQDGAKEQEIRVSVATQEVQGRAAESWCQDLRTPPVGHDG